MEKVGTSLSSDDSGQSNTTEEIFRCIQTLQSLIENPPGDFPDNLQGDIVKGFVGIFSYVRKDGKISGVYQHILAKGWSELGCRSLEIHYAVQQFVFHCWSTVQDRGVKDISVFNETMVILLPAAIFALSAGSSFPHCEGEAFALNFIVDVLVVPEDLATAEGHEQANSYELFTCSPEVLAEINTGSGAEVCQAQQCQSVRLSRQLRDHLLHEMKDCVLEAVVNERIERMLLSEIIFKSALLSNFICSSSIIRFNKLYARRK